ncbi:cellulose biosynthesis protein BcsQ [Bordetella avium]|uniref:Cellulose biosynthesis protein n=1 Tax=Bordetella avium (strain 197N) TaxID=360910 RepID=Q2KWQ4_BORA1|nr:cellulose biosynthesis protein BcsQ [Bordetella avium]RIQ52006.1 cellulose synthase operon protein YhjQ [Bordetella avium]RIQ69129.1 cellulose synthase operon protein YhjQ [Bordetella avium]CAJ50242.1 cellulose biosynthesis protein [Bordetella avium 197N]
MKILAIVSAKGGVGKTTVAANLSVALEQSGAATLMVDLDPQNALRFHLGADELTGIEGLARASLAGQDWRSICVQGVSGVHLLPFGALNEEDRLRLEQQMNADPKWLTRHLAALDLGPEAVVLVDTPPGPSAYLRQALECADLVLAVTLADAASFATLPSIESLVAQYCEGRPGYLGHAYLVNQVDSAQALAKDTAQVLRGALGNRVIGVVQRDVSVADALAFGKTVIEHAPYSQPSQDFANGAAWVMQQFGTGQ